MKQLAIDWIDIFGQTPTVMVFGKNKFNTLIGLLTTLMIGVITLFYFAAEVIQMIEKSEPAVVSTEFQVFETAAYPLYNENFTLAVSVSTASGNIYNGNGKYYNITISQCIRNRVIGDNGAQKVTIECEILPIETCNMTHFTTDTQIEYFQKMKFGAMQCINRDYLTKNPPQLQGQLNAITFQYLEIQLKPCVNSTDIQTCAPKEEVDAILMNGHYLIYMSDYLMQQSDSIQPYKQIMTNQFTSFSLSTSKIIQSYFQIIETTSDDGLLFQSLRTATNIKLRDTKESSDFYNQDFLVDHYIALDYRSQKYSRSYIKVQAILSKIGGIWQIFIIFVATIIKPFVTYKMNIAIANQIFRFTNNILPTDFRSTFLIMAGCNKIQKKQYNIATSLILQNLDIVKIIQKKQEIERLKQILLSEEQNLLFSVLPKPLIYQEQPQYCRSVTSSQNSKLLQTHKESQNSLAECYQNIMCHAQLDLIDKRILRLFDKETLDQLQKNYDQFNYPKSPQIESKEEDINEPVVALPK